RREAIPHVRRGWLHARKLAHRAVHAPAELVVRDLAARASDDRERLGQGAAGVEAPQRGNELATRQVARGAEDDARERLVGERRQCYRAPPIGRSAAAAPTASQISSPSVGRIIPAGTIAWSDSTALTIFAFSPPATSKITRAAAFSTGNVSVNRCGIVAAVTCTAAT